MLNDDVIDLYNRVKVGDEGRRDLRPPKRTPAPEIRSGRRFRERDAGPVRPSRRRRRRHRSPPKSSSSLKRRVLEIGVLEVWRSEPPAPEPPALPKGLRSPKFEPSALACDAAAETAAERAVAGARRREGVHERVAEHHAAGDAAAVVSAVAEKAAAAALRRAEGAALAGHSRLTHARLAHAGDPRPALAWHRSGLRSGLPPGPSPGPALLRLAEGRPRALGLARAAAEQAGQEAAALRALPQLLDLGLERLELGVEVLQRLLLDEDRLRHGIGRIGLLPDLLLDEALRLGIARLVRDLLEAL